MDKGFIEVLFLTLVMSLGVGCMTNTSSEDNMNEGSDFLPASPKGAKTGWSKTGTLTTIPLTPKSEQMQADFSEPGQYTVQFSVEQVAEPDATFLQRAKAIVTWSVEGNFVQRQISLYDGASVSGVGQGVKVVMMDDSLSISAPVPPATHQQDYKVSCQVARGTRPSQQQPPFYNIQTSASGAGTTTSIAIPQNIGAISVFAEAATDLVALGVTVKVDIVSQSGSTLATWALNDSVLWRPLPPGAASIMFTRSNALLHPAYSVNIGIDG